jgi:CDP-diacylglycerol--serine O-phosphatidyltransferase
MNPRPDRQVPLRRVIPSVLTTVALCSGLAAVHFVLKPGAEGDQAWKNALGAIGLAAVFDVLDGRAARMLRATSRFGAVLDSLSDFLCFGVAPALVLYQWQLKDTDVGGLAALVTYVLCAALRLARFTSMPRTPVKHAPLTMFFTGLPSPAGAAIVLVPLMLFVSKTTGYETPKWVVAAWTMCIGLLMISRIPMYSIKKIKIKRKLVPLLLVALGLIVVMAVRDTWLAVALIALAYLLTLPLSVAHHARTQRRIAAGAP